MDARLVPGVSTQRRADYRTRQGVMTYDDFGNLRMEIGTSRRSRTVSNASES